MDLFDRIYKLHHVLSQSHYPVSLSKLRAKLECSRATVNRIIRDMRLYLGAPIEFQRKESGYHYPPGDKPPYELPGLWFNTSELQALLATQQLLAGVQPGLLDAHLAPLRERIKQILKSKRIGSGQISKRVRILGMACRKIDPEYFQKAANALLQRKQLSIVYHSRSRNQTTERTISPQRLVHYRDNWYLDAWDHGKRALRSFAVERIQKAVALKRPARKIPDSRLDAYFGTAYGIFAGKPKHTAILRFSPERSRWVAEEQWHSQQKGCFENGCYVLEVPYSDTRELVMDILKHGPHVEVLEPQALRQEVVSLLEKALERQKKIKSGK